MGRATELERDKKRWFEMVDSMQKMAWNAEILDEALAMAWKYMLKCEMREREIEWMKKQQEAERRLP